jgi:putative membrane protein
MWGGGDWWLIGALVMVVCVVMMIRMMSHGGSGHGDHGGAGHTEGSSNAVDILAARFARGEISEEEFQQRKRVLEGSSHQAS